MTRKVVSWIYKTNFLVIQISRVLVWLKITRKSETDQILTISGSLSKKCKVICGEIFKMI